MTDYSLQRRELVSRLKKRGYITSKSVERAMTTIPREAFVSSGKKQLAYLDRPLDIGNGQTISAPHMVAIMSETMELRPGQKVLEIGTGSGYHAAIVATIIGDKGHLYSIERFDDLANQAKKRLNSIGVNNVSVIVGDGSIGLEKFAPYDCIYVTCSAPSIPEPFREQVCLGGRIVIPIGRITGELIVLIKKKHGFQRKSYGGCAFVPLIGKFGFKL